MEYDVTGMFRKYAERTSEQTDKGSGHYNEAKAPTLRSHNVFS